MDSKKIEELLTKYWNCETSLEEERQLREYFHNGHIPETMKETAALFQYFNTQKSKALADLSFEGRILGKVTNKQSNSVQLIKNTLRIAAGIAVLMVAIWWVHSEVSVKRQPEVADTFTDPQRAFEETKKALLMISKNFDIAEEQARKINLFNEAREELQLPRDEKNKNQL